MINGVIIKKIKKNHDQRGWLAEIYRNDQVNFKPAMSYISLSKPGVVRGPHEHIKQSDFFVFIGPGNFTLHLWDRRAKSKTKGQYFKIEVGEKNPCLVIVPPGVVHGYKCVGKTPAISLNLPDKLYLGRYKKGKRDEIRWEKDPKSPYKIK